MGRERQSLVVRLIEATTRRSFEQAIGGRVQAGMSFRQIAREFGVNHVTIWQEWQKRQSHDRARL